MKTIPFKLPDSEHAAFKAAAAAEGLTMQEVLARSATAMITERAAQARFALRAKRGNPAKAKALLKRIRSRLEG